MQRATPESVHNQPLTLDVLSSWSLSECAMHYREAVEPTSLDALDGRPRGRMLAVRGLAPLQPLLNAFAASEAFPWGGKSFVTAQGAESGRGINRVRLGGVHELFGFETRIEPSAIDGRDCVMLDYDQPQNPGFIAKIRDEIRELEPGIWMGPAMWKGDGGPALVLWFALDFNDPDPRPAFELR